jgi:hypothetical protein
MEHIMKTKIATALSLVGVLSAGSAAALVNTTILDNGPAKSGQSAAVPEQVASTSASVASTAASSSTTANTLPASTTASTTPSTIVVTVPAASTVPTGFLTTFNVGDAGAVTVDVINGGLTIVSSTPNAGWQIVKSEQKIEENKVEVYFQAATVQVEFEASFVNGQIVPEVNSSASNGTVPGGTVAGGTVPSNTVSGGTVPSNTTGNTIDDDDDDDDDDDETDNTIADDGDDDDDNSGHGGGDDDRDDD